MEFAITLTDIIILLMTGGIAGVLAGLFGIGGGIVLVPGLLYVFTAQGLSGNIMHMAVGTSLAIIIPTGWASARGHFKKGAFNKQAFINWAPGIVLGVVCGSYLAALLDGADLKAIFAIAICVLAVLMQIDPQKIRAGRKRAEASDEADNQDLPAIEEGAPRLTTPAPAMKILTPLGVGVGTLSSLMGIGGATMTVPAMSLLGMHIRESVATASAIGILIAVPAAIGFAVIGMAAGAYVPDVPLAIGYINVLAAAIILPASIVCTKWGVALAHKLPFKNLKQIFALFMVFVAIRMLWSVWQ